MTLIELYRSQGDDGINGEISRTLLKQMHWFTVNTNFDPKTGEALPQALSGFLAKVAGSNTAGRLHDRLWRITEHARLSVERIFRSINESPRREQALLPVRAVRELDVNSFIKLSNRPGRNIREKLAGKPHLQAVRRFQSVNVTENRLLKEFVTRLAELLELRQSCLGEEADELLPRIQSWLLSDEAQTIDRWDNLPPNNTLLSNRDYRRVWDAWRWLQTLDDDIARDFSQLEARAEAMRLWNHYGQNYLDGTHLFAEMPVHFDYEKFEIRPWLSQLAFQKGTRKIARYFDVEKTSEPVCVDLAELRPHYATTNASSKSLCDTYLWQQWENNVESVDIELFHSDAAYLHPDASSISSTDLFFSRDNSLTHLDRAARAFASKLRDIFKNDTLIWLVPDFLNDFELEITRRNLNARFKNAEPVPRSVAAVFELVDFSKIKFDRFAVVVVDTIDGKTCVTKLIARFDTELKKRLPENGFYWERCPPVIIAQRDSENEEGKKWQNYKIIIVDGEGQWHDTNQAAKPHFVVQNRFRLDPRIGEFALYLNLTHSPVNGGIRLHSLQQRAGDIPLWRDNIPELSIGVKEDGPVLQRYCIVSRGTTVKPIRGLAVPIAVNEYFTLPAGVAIYKFPLFQGENADEVGFSARLESPAFPLQKDTVCKLNLTFEYGADEPYKLIFEPLGKSFPPVRATWRRTEEVTDAPAPEYPMQMTWENLRHFPDTKLGGSKNLIHEIGSTACNLKKWLSRGDNNAWDKLKKTLKSWCRFLFLSIWRDGRSISDSGCPKEFIDVAKDLLGTLWSVATHPVAVKHGISEYDMMFLFCAIHKDMPKECVYRVYQWAEEQDDKYARLIGFALGDVSKDWQKTVLSDLLRESNDFTLNVLSYAIWREQSFVEKFSAADLGRILKSISVRLANIKPIKFQLQCNTTQMYMRQWIYGRNIAEPLELLLGLLRTRASTNHEIKMLLQPNQKITRELAKQVRRVTNIVAQSNVNLFSRVQLNIQKPVGDSTADLLYALNLYLNGQADASTIRITSVFED
jgi:hypothetical protein